MSSESGKHFLETALFEFRRMKKMTEIAAGRLDDREFEFRENENDNSVKIIVQHLAGNLLSRWTNFLSEDGEKPWRNRDEEFEQLQITKAELMKKWEAGWAELFNAIEPLNESHLLQHITIRGEKLTVTQAIVRQLAHYSYHTGQIVFLAKKIKGEKWESLSIPKGKSSEFSNKGTYLGKNPG